MISTPIRPARPSSSSPSPSLITSSRRFARERERRIGPFCTIQASSSLLARRLAPRRRGISRRLARLCATMASAPRLHSAPLRAQRWPQLPARHRGVQWRNAQKRATNLGWPANVTRHAIDAAAGRWCRSDARCSLVAKATLARITAQWASSHSARQQWFISSFALAQRILRKGSTHLPI